MLYNNKNNLIWIVIDCVRNYKSETDDRDKLDIMYELEDEFASFSNMMVSAPSSIMSAVNFFTSVPSYYIAGNYAQFQFDKTSYWCIKDLLELNGYKNYAVMNSLDLRSMLIDLVDPIDKKFWTHKVRATMMRWPNSEVTKTFYNLLDSKPPDPSFHFLWYNTRLDPLMSDEIKGLITNLKERGLFEDSIVIITSDHGYPDRERGLVSDGWDLWKAGLRHDIILTNDNINIPFLIYYPGVKPGIVDNLISTEDIVPTLMELLKIDIPYEKKLPLFGRSLIPLINNIESDFFKERVIRTDARFSLQKDRNTSLQQNNYHYIVRHDDFKEELYDTRKDPKEKNNIVSDVKNEKIIEFFREHFATENDKILKLQKQNAYEKLLVNFETLQNSKLIIDNCWVIAFSNSYLYETVIEALHIILPKLKISIIVPDKNKINIEDKKYLVDVIYYNESEIKKQKKAFNKKDLRIEVVDDPVSPEFRIAYNRFSFIHGKKIIRINWNGVIYNISWMTRSPKILHYKSNYKKVLDRIKLGIGEPIYFAEEFVRLSRRVFGKR